MRKKFILFISILFIFSCIRIDTGKDIIKKIYYKGIITKIYNDESNHYMNTFVIKTKDSIFEDVANLYPRSWEFANVGDSIIKPADTLMIIIKKQDSTYKEFFYKF